MQILTVIPIARGISKDTLSYFTKNAVTIGSVVSIPLRGKRAYGLVVASKSANESKSEIKTLPYSMKKAGDVEAHSFLSPAFMKASEKIADYNAASVGAVLSALIPKHILEESASFSYVPQEQPKGLFYETLLLQTDDEERYATYRSLIREEFARGRSVFFILPTTEDLLTARSTLEKGIEKYTHTLHSGLSKKEIVNGWKIVTEETHPVLLIATGSFLSLPRNDLGTIIIEKESIRGFKMQTRPFLDIRTVALILAKESKVRLVLGDLFLRIETLWAEKEGKYATLSPLKFRALTSANCEIVSTKTPADMKKKQFSIFSDELKKLISNARENNEYTFLFCGRKGLYPLTICTDCGTIVTCKNCNAPNVLYGRKDGQSRNLFVCHHCGERRDAEELCRNCKGWRLNPLGIGIERVTEELKNLFSDAKVIVMDKDHVKNHKQAVKVRDSFYATPGAILVGTEMALTYLNQKVENAAVVSLDSYFSIPDFRIHEKIFHILISMRGIADKQLLIQTRQEDSSQPWKIFEYAIRGNLMDFYRDEIEDRRTVGFPPFTTYIKLTVEGEKIKVKKVMEEIAETLKPYELSAFNAWNPGSKTKFSMHGLVSLPKGNWPDKELLEKLRVLPPSVSIKIDPDTLL